MAQVARKIPVAGIAKMLPIITALAGIAYAVAAYGLLFLPKIGRLVAAGELDLAPYQDRVNETDAYSNSLKSVAAGFQGVNPDRRSRVLNMVPLTPDVPALYVQVDAIAKAHDMVLASIDAAPDERSSSPAGRKTIRVTVTVAGGTYQQFKLLLGDLERSERIFDVESVIFTPATGSFAMVLHAYSLDLRSVLQAPIVPPTPGAQ